jgi:hypothetical protein
MVDFLKSEDYPGVSRLTTWVYKNRASSKWCRKEKHRKSQRYLNYEWKSIKYWWKKDERGGRKECSLPLEAENSQVLFQQGTGSLKSASTWNWILPTTSISLKVSSLRASTDKKPVSQHLNEELVMLQQQIQLNLPDA